MVEWAPVLGCFLRAACDYRLKYNRSGAMTQSVKHSVDFPMYNIAAGAESGRSADFLQPLGVCVCVCVTSHPQQLHLLTRMPTIDLARRVIMMDGHVSLWGTGGRLRPINSALMSPPPPPLQS